jgi:uncharacterized ion transporter superfamily protein YfcC
MNSAGNNSTISTGKIVFYIICSIIAIANIINYCSPIESDSDISLYYIKNNTYAATSQIYECTGN